jgi:ribonucleoside-diphosphate reductase alpha chain
MEVIKRNGEKSRLDAEKINKVLMWATENISGVSASDVAMNAHIQFYQGIKTTEIHNVLIQSAVDLISEKNPNYQYVASNLLNYLLRIEALEVNGENLPSLFDIIKINVKLRAPFFEF